jgi:hypothetical protein
MTPMPGKPFVLHVDDDPDELRTWEDEVRTQAKIELEVCHPDDVSEEALRRASVVLVDFKLERWPERANTKPLALKPANGLALLSILQEAAFEIEPATARAFALYTAVIQDVARGLAHQPHIVARAHNLEWVFEKNGTRSNGLVSRAAKVAELAAAVSALPAKWPGDAPESAASALRTWLNLPADVAWHGAAWRAVRRCRPPLHAFAEHTQGVGVLRWALHRVLPYPTFLLDEAHLAARLRVPLDSLRSGLDSTEFHNLFSSVEYQGQLRTVAGRRWWRAGIESVIFSLTPNTPGDLGALHVALSERTPALKLESELRLFPVLDRQFGVQDRLASEAEVVEVVPDDWPPFADEAWALRADLADSPELKAVVVEEEEEA